MHGSTVTRDKFSIKEGNFGRSKFCSFGKCSFGTKHLHASNFGNSSSSPNKFDIIRYTLQWA